MKKIIGMLAFVLSLMSMGMVDTYAITLSEIMERSTTLELNVPVAESLKTDESENWYKFVVAEQGYYQFHFSLTENTNLDNIGYGWDINIFSGKDLVNVMKNYGSINNNMKSQKMTLAPGEYYIKVNGVYGDAVGCEYAIGMDFVADTSWEFEDNNTWENANVIEFGNVYNAQLLNDEDQDWYKIELKDPGFMKINFLLSGDTDTELINDGWSVSLYNADKKEIKKYTGVTTNQIFDNYISYGVGTYYVKIQGDGYSYPVDCAYSFKLDYEVAEFWEIESNETKETANEITANQAYNGAISSGEDVDYYKVKIENQGYFKVQFQVDEKNVADVEWGWNIYVVDTNSNVIKQFTGIDNLMTAELPFQTGEYYVAIEPNHANYAPVDCIYKLYVINESSDSWETEKNDDQNSVNVITTNKTYFGTIYGKDDVDWYKVNIENTGYFKVQLQVDPNNTNNIEWGWNLTISDKNLKVIKQYAAVENVTSPELPFQAGEYYIKIEPQNTNYAPIDCIYNLCVASESSDSWEIEENNTQDLANTISVDKVYDGTLYTKDDVDWYKVDIKKTGYFKIKFQLDKNTGDKEWGWNISILDKNLSVIKQYTGVEENLNGIVLPYPIGVYYVKVEAYNTNYAPVDCIYSLSVSNTAAGDWEVEKNNDKGTARKISANKAYNGLLYDGTDVDWYKVNIDKKGYFQLQFNVDESATEEAIDWGWNVSILDKNQNVLIAYEEVEKSFKGGILPYQPGDYYVKVEPNSKNYSPNECQYSVCVVTKAASNWELEGTNDDSSVAATAVNKTVQGIFHKREDVDWYRFNISNTGYFQLKFDIDKKVIKENIKDGWKITIYDKNLEEVKTYTGVKTKLTSGAIPYPKGTYYVKIEGDIAYSWNEAPVNCVYSVQMVSRTSSSFETENNNEKSKADSISVNKEYHGILTTTDDEDWYKLVVPSNGKVLLKFSKHSTVASSTVGTGWKVEIYQGSKLIKKYENVKTSFKYTVDLKKGTYYVKVQAQDGYNTNPPVDRRYTVKASFTAKPATSSIKSISTKSKTVTLTWNQSSKATGYYVYRATSKNGTYRKVATIKNKSTVKYTDKNNLKKKARYYYKVVSYTTANGLTVLGSAGSIKSIQVK